MSDIGIDRLMMNTLPLFFKLEQRPVLIVGGGEVEAGAAVPVGAGLEVQGDGTSGGGQRRTGADRLGQRCHRGAAEKTTFHHIPADGFLPAMRANRQDCLAGKPLPFCLADLQASELSYWYWGQSASNRRSVLDQRHDSSCARRALEHRKR